MANQCSEPSPQHLGYSAVLTLRQVSNFTILLSVINAHANFCPQDTKCKWIHPGTNPSTKTQVRLPHLTYVAVGRPTSAMNHLWDHRQARSHCWARKCGPLCTLRCIRITERILLNAGSESEGLREGQIICIADKLPG